MKKKFTHGDASERGTIRQITYTTRNEKGETVEKYANIYLPCRYDPEKRYNIFYLMHGGGGNPDAWLDSSPLKNMLDLSIQRGELEPLLVVTPRAPESRGWTGSTTRRSPSRRSWRRT